MISSIRDLFGHSSAFAFLASLSLMLSLETGCGSSGGGDSDDGGIIDSDAGDSGTDAEIKDPDSGSQEADGGTDAGRDASSEEEDGSISEDAGDASEELEGRSCASPERLVGASGEITLTWTLEDPAGRFQGSCGGNGSEYVFQLDVPVRSTFEIRLADGDVDGVLYVRSSCSSEKAEDEVGCSDGLNADVVRGDLNPGSYFVFADAFANVASGEQKLSWKVSDHPCNGVSCGSGASCELSSSGTPECQCASPDQVYGGLEMGCVLNPCLNHPCSADASTECAYSEETLPAHECVPRQWTLMVFMSADNNLYSNSFSDMEEIRRASQSGGPTAGVRAVILRDGFQKGDTVVMTVRDGVVEVLENEGTFLGSRNELNMSEGESLSEFGVWAVSKFPAEHYALILWDHGSGWKSSAVSRGFSNDVSSNENPSQNEIFISTGEYGTALEKITEAIDGKIDLLAFDACQMGLYETALASKPYADYLLASEERIPDSGYNYFSFMSALFADDRISTLEWASAFPEKYIETSSVHYTMALTDLGKLDELTQPLNALGNILASAAEESGGSATADNQVHNAIFQARRKSLYFHNTAYIDLGDFALNLSREEEIPLALKEKAEDVLNGIKSAVVDAQGRSFYLRTQGIGIYFPDAGEGVDEAYFLETAPWHGSGWMNFLNALRTDAQK